MSTAHISSQIIRALEFQQTELEFLINQTPTGEARNAFTEANIHLLQAILCLRDGEYKAQVG